MTADPQRRIDDALEKGDGLAALEALLELWRQTFDPQLTALVSALTLRLTPVNEAPAARVERDQVIATLALLQKPELRTPAVVTLVGPLLLGAPVNALQLAEGLAALEADPRLEAPLLHALTRRRLEMSVRWYRAVGKALQLHAHARAAETVAAVLPAAGDRRSSVASLVARLRRKQPRPVKPESVERWAKLIANQVFKVKVEVPLEQLLAPVYERPDDPAVRAVLADQLLERSNPRGEFIALQLRRAQAGTAPSDRELALRDQHREEWLAPLWPLLDAESELEFAGGFLDRCTIKGGISEARRAVVLARPEWATVTRISLEKGALLSPQMKSLRRLENVQASQLDKLARFERLPPLRELGLRATHDLGPLRAALTRLGARLLLERASLEASAAPAEVMALAVDVPAKAIHVKPDEFHQWRSPEAWALVEALPPRVTRFSVTLWDSMRVQLTRTDAGWTELKLDSEVWDSALHRFRYAFEMLAGRDVREVTFVATEFKSFKPQLTALASRHFPAAAVAWRRRASR